MQVQKSVSAPIIKVAIATLILAASAQAQTKSYELSGPRLTAHFQVKKNHLRFTWFKSAADGKMLQPGEAFSMMLRDGRVITASQVKINVIGQVAHLSDF